jgi:LAO/AO transport system kinase
MLARAITLIESSAARDGVEVQALLARLLPHTGGAVRVGITGVPGVGKSTLVERLGMQLIDKGHRVAVLAVDPSSALSGGSILGDKTRMAKLSVAPNAFIRPSPSGLSPGGVARRSREAMLVCEAAGFDVVLVETVGVGQGEIAVAAMVDFFLVLMLPGAGDELQGIKKGVLELADAIVVNKCDGDNLVRAQSALADLRAALRYLPRKRQGVRVSVLTASGMTGDGVEAIWETIVEQRAALVAAGELARLRAEQQRSWMWSLIGERLDRAFRAHPAVANALSRVEAAVLAGEITPTAAADELLDDFGVQRGE